MTPQRREDIEQWANRFGPPNCWAGTSGTAATMIRELMAEIDELKIELRLARDLAVFIQRQNDELAIRPIPESTNPDRGA